MLHLSIAGIADDKHGHDFAGHCQIQRLAPFAGVFLLVCLLGHRNIVIDQQISIAYQNFLFINPGGGAHFVLIQHPVHLRQNGLLTYDRVVKHIRQRAFRLNDHRGGLQNHIVDLGPVKQLYSVKGAAFGSKQVVGLHHQRPGVIHRTGTGKAVDHGLALGQRTGYALHRCITGQQRHRRQRNTKGAGTGVHTHAPILGQQGHRHQQRTAKPQHNAAGSSGDPIRRILAAPDL